MAEWKKVIVSGSNAHLNEVTASKFKGDGSAITGVTATTLGNTIVDGNGIADFSFDASSGATVSIEADGSTLSVGASGVKVADAGITGTQLNASVAGAGLAGGAGSALSVDLNELGAAAVDNSADSIVFIDASDNSSKKESIADLVAGMDGTGLTATNGVLAVDAAQSQITSLGTLTALTVDDIAMNGAVIGHTSDTDLITLASGVVTVAGELDAQSLDVSGNVDIDGTLEADAITIDDKTMSEFVSDTVGAMVGSNTETGISVSYDDSDNTLDFVIGAGSIVDSMLNDDVASGLAGAGTTATSGVLNVIGGDGITVNADEVEAAVDDSSIELSATNGSGVLQVKASGITNAMLNGSIANDKLANSSVSLGGVSVALGGTDATPAFDLQDATGYATTALVGTITNAQLAGSISNDKLANSSITVGGSETALGGTVAGSHIAAALNADLGGDVSFGNQTDDKVTFAGGVTIEGNLTVQGSQTIVSSSNLLVEDKFILLNSGSNAGDGGLVVQNGSDNQGSAFVFDDSADRWGFQVDLNHTATTSTPTAYAAAAVKTEGSAPPAVYNKNGNIQIDNDGEIYIYVE
tara:strand:- start:491 stop:2239 length:1749 start_codon:yes stop_codon:yes gene_type:complete